MKNFKKVLALVLAVVMLLSFATVASAKTVGSDFYKDADDIDYTEAVDVLGYIGVLNGYPDDTFKPENTITRAEAAKIIAIFDNKSADISKLYASANPFADCVGNWAESFIAYGVKTGIIAGRNATTFDPKGNVTGVEFLKMALVVLGYDAKAEGLEGKNWDVNTLALAKRVGLTKSLGNKFDYADDLKRQEAAVIMLDALRAGTVEYGSKYVLAGLKWDKEDDRYYLDGKGNSPYMTVAGACETGDTLGKGWGLTEGYKHDSFMRPYRTWKLNGTVIGSYMFPVAAEFTTEYDACDLLVELGISTSNISDSADVVAAWINGKYDGNYKMYSENGLKHDTVSYQDNCSMTHKIEGAQGTLTQVFDLTEKQAKAIYGETGTPAGYYVTEIDTFLAKVNKTSSKTTNKEGHIVKETVATLEVYGADCDRYIVEDAATTTASGLKAGDIVLVRLSDLEKSTIDNDVVYNVVEMATPETKTGAFNGKKTNNYVKQTRIDGEYVPNALHFHMGYKDWQAAAFGTKVFYFDTYGNVIGMTDPTAGAAQYLTITKMWFEFNKGDASIHANVTTMDGETTKDVTVKRLAGLTADQYMETHIGAAYITEWEYSEVFVPGWGHRLYTYSVNADGTYNISGETGHPVTDVTFTKGNPQVMNSNDEKAFAVDSDTQFLIHEGDGSYKAVTGFKTLDSMFAAKAIYVNGSDGYADIVYLCDPKRDGDTFIGWYTGVTRERVIEASGVQYFGFVVYVDGVETTVWMKQGEATLNNRNAGWVELTYHNEGDIDYVELNEHAGDNLTNTKISKIKKANCATVNAVGKDTLTWNSTEYAVADSVKVYKVDTDRKVVTAADEDFALDMLVGNQNVTIWTVYGQITEIYVYGGWNW